MPRPQILLHEHDTQTMSTKTNNKSEKVHQLDPEAAAWPQQHNDNKPQSSSSSSASTLDQADLLEYMYQHVQFDEIPFANDPLYDHRQIYTHENTYMAVDSFPGEQTRYTILLCKYFYFLLKLIEIKKTKINVHYSLICG